MKKASLTVLFSLSLLAGAAYAQTDEGGVMMSTDPAKAADVEQRAQALAQQQEQMQQMPMQEHEHMSKKMMHHHPMHKHAAKSKAKADKAEAASGASQ